MEKERVNGTVKKCSEESGWCHIDGDDRNEYETNISAKFENCGMLNEGQRISFISIPDAAFVPWASEVRVI